MKRKNIVITVIALVIIVVFAVTLIILHNENKIKQLYKDVETHTVISKEEYEKMTNEAELIDGYVEPGKNTLEVDKIQGYTSKKNVKNPNSNATGLTSNGTATDEGKTSKVELSDSNLMVESVGAYIGNYLEDGSDDPIKNVASIVVSNVSDKMLQIANITFQVQENETAVFRVTNLPPHTSALVLEANRREYSDKDDYSFGNVANSYMEKPDLMKKQFKVTKENGTLVLKNKTKKSYKKVYVYYKYIQLGGLFKGGITYRVPFENVEAGKSVTSTANHLRENMSVIVDVQIAEE